MLDIALQFLRDELNTYIHTHTGSNTVEVNLAQVVDDSGKYLIKPDSLGATIINIEEERILKSQLPEYSNVDGRHVVLEPKLKLTLHVLFAANFKFYDMALKHLALVLTYFQSHPSFTPEEYPGLDQRIDKLLVELQSLTYEQLNQIWAYIGGKHLPSAVYKVRMVAIQGEAPTAVQPPLTIIKTDIRSR